MKANLFTTLALGIKGSIAVGEERWRREEKLDTAKIYIQSMVLL